VGFDPVAVAAQRCEVVSAGLAWWAEGVVGADVIEVEGVGGFAGAVGEELDGVREFDVFADAEGDFVGVRADGLIEVDDGLDGVGGVPDGFGELVGDQGPDVFDAEYSGAGGQGVIGEVDVDLGLAWARGNA
jgi:hypothetical protein